MIAEITSSIGEIILASFAPLALTGIAFIVRAQINMNKIFSDGIQVAMSELKLLRMLSEEKEASREKACGFHSEQIKDLKTKTDRMDDDIINLDDKLNKHVIEYNHTKKK